MPNSFREVFICRVGTGDAIMCYGHATGAAEDLDFFTLRNFITTNKKKEPTAKIFMMHTHPRNFLNLSTTDTDTFKGLRFGLDYDFFAGFVTPEVYRLFSVRLINKKVVIKELSWSRKFIIELTNLYFIPDLNKIVQESCYA